MTDLQNNLKFIDGREIANSLLEQLKLKVLELKIKPKFVVIQIGSDEASNMYIKMKLKRASEVGITAIHTKLEENTTQEQLEEVIEKLNKDSTVHGLFIQSPLPKHLDFYKACNLIDTAKDIDGLGSTNLGKLFTTAPRQTIEAYPAATAYAALECLLAIENYKLSGKHAVIINRSNVLGKPLAALLLNHDATVTIAHSKTTDLQGLCKSADIIITATGQANLINANFVKDEVVLIDCGAPNAEVDINSIAGKANYVTPVPGGVGPVTIACLLRNVVNAAELAQNKTEG